MKKILLSSALLLSAASANALDINITYADPDEVGFNSIEPYTGTAYNVETLGEARKLALNEFVQMLSSQLPDAGVVDWNVAMNDKYQIPQSHYDVVYYEPSEDSPPIDGKLQTNRIYSEILFNALSTEAGTSRLETTFPVEFDYVLGDASDENSLYQASLREWLPALGLSLYNNANQGFFDKVGYRTNLIYQIVERDDLDTGAINKNNFFEMINLMTDKHYALEIGSSTQSYAEFNVSGMIEEKYLPIITQEEFSFNTDPETGQLFINEGDLTEDDQFYVPFYIDPAVTYPEVLPNLGLNAYLLCDIGWCNTSASNEIGQVVDLTAQLYVETNQPRANLPVFAEVTLENDEEIDLKNVELKVNYDKSMSVPIYNDPDFKQHCVFDKETTSNEDEASSLAGFTCKFDTVFAGESKTIGFEIKAAEGDYLLYAKVGTGGNYIDIDGTNNFAQEELKYRHKDSGGEIVGDNGSAGGSASWLSLLGLSLLLGLRRTMAK